jgi:hypothetical protein
MSSTQVSRFPIVMPTIEIQAKILRGALIFEPAHRAKPRMQARSRDWELLTGQPSRCPNVVACANVEPRGYKEQSRHPHQAELLWLAPFNRHAK